MSHRYVCVLCGRDFEIYIGEEEKGEPILSCPFCSDSAVRCDNWDEKFDLQRAVKKQKESEEFIDNIRNKRRTEAAEMQKRRMF